MAWGQWSAGPAHTGSGELTTRSSSQLQRCSKAGSPLHQSWRWAFSSTEPDEELNEGLSEGTAGEVNLVTF